MGRCDWFLKFLSIVIKMPCHKTLWLVFKIPKYCRGALWLVSENTKYSHFKKFNGACLNVVGTFIGTLICKKVLGFKWSTDLKGLMRWQNCYGFLAWECLNVFESVWDPLLLIFGMMFMGPTMQKQTWLYNSNNYSLRNFYSYIQFQEIV